MGKRLYVGNLGYDVSDADLSQLFTECGTVESASVVTDKSTGQSKGFGFVEMSTEQEAQAAIAALDGRDHSGRPLKVNEAKPRPEGSSRGRGGFGGGGGGGGRRY